MKYILLMRHATSSHENSNVKDYDRPLTEQGSRDARQMGAFIREIDYQPGVIIFSPAKRATQTTQLVIEGTGMDEGAIQWDEDFYYGSSDNYLKAIQQAKDVSDTIMLVGHNPKIEDIIRRLCGNGSVRMPAGGLACLEQPAREWNQIREGLASLKWMMIPEVLNRVSS